MSQFTPGPCELLAEENLTLVIASAEPRIDDKAFGIAIIPHHKDADRIHWETKKANAQLIAAAPSLLAALEAYVADDECCKNPDYDTRVEVHPCPATCTGNYCKALKAIEEARGETP